MLDFIGIGSRWAGEEWLYDQLRRHPEIHFPRDLEMGFWSTHYLKGLEQKDYGRDLNWYRSIFGHWNESAAPGKVPVPAKAELPTQRRSWFDRLMARLDSGAAPASSTVAQQGWAKRSNYRLGDFSPSYCRFDDPRILPAIRAFAPDLKILYIVRNPMERAFAAAEKLREVAGLKPEEVSDAWYEDHFRAQQSLRQGDYAANLDMWRAHFPENQILILRYDEILTAPQEILGRALRHIDVEDKNFFQNQPAHSFLPHRAVDNFGIRPSLIPVLSAVYREKMDDLRARFGLDFKAI